MPVRPHKEGQMERRRRELLDAVAELGVQATGMDWSGHLALVVEALGRRRAAGAAGRRSESDRQLERALAFYREVGAGGYLRGGGGLRSASA
jgi:hypothetical protein